MIQRKPLLLLSTLIIFVIFFELVFADYYKTLGVPRGASEQQIKQAFKKLALKYHPDKNKDKDAKDKFIEISHAYDVLSDPKKKQIYDTYGEEGLKQGAGGGQPGGFDPNSIFEQFFGGGGGGGGGFRFNFGGGGFGFGGGDEETEDEFKGNDLRIPLTVTLEDLYNGKTLLYKRVRTAHQDDAQPKKCECRNKTIRMMYVNGVMKRIVENNCEECKNRFDVIQKTTELSVEIEAGMDSGEEIIFYGEGDATEATRAGDLIFVLQTIKHRKFERIQKNDLKMKMKISLKEALVGFSKTITHLDGRKLELKSEQILKHGDIMKVHNEGMPGRHGGKKGDLYIEFSIVYPTSLTAEQKELVTKALP